MTPEAIQRLEKWLDESAKPLPPEEFHGGCPFCGADGQEQDKLFSAQLDDEGLREAATLLVHAAKRLEPVKESEDQECDRR